MATKQEIITLVELYLAVTDELEDQIYKKSVNITLLTQQEQIRKQLEDLIRDYGSRVSRDSLQNSRTN